MTPGQSTFAFVLGGSFQRLSIRLNRQTKYPYAYLTIMIFLTKRSMCGILFHTTVCAISISAYLKTRQVHSIYLLLSPNTIFLINDFWSTDDDDDNDEQKIEPTFFVKLFLPRRKYRSGFIIFTYLLCLSLYLFISVSFNPVVHLSFCCLLVNSPVLFLLSICWL